MIVKPIGHGGIAAFERGEVMAGLEQRGKMCYSSGYGFATLGITRAGEATHAGGIYQRRIKGYNNKTGKPSGGNEHYFVKMRSYAPTNPRTEAQQANRAKMAAACAAWQQLTNEQKNVYNAKARKYGRVGRQYFISETLKNSI